MAERLLRVAEQQAASTTALAEMQRQNLATFQAIERNVAEHARILERVADKLEAMESERDGAVQVILEHVTKQSDRVFVTLRFIGIAIVVSNLLGLPLGQMLEALMKAHG